MPRPITQIAPLPLAPSGNSDVTRLGWMFLRNLRYYSSSDCWWYMAEILVAEDEPVIVAFLTRLLGKAGHTVVGFGDGRAALVAAAKHGFDLAIVDIGLPGLDGISVLHELRESQPHVPRILMSGGLDLPTVVKAINRGEIAQVLEKPFSGGAVLEAVERALETRAQVEARLAGASADESLHREALAECLEGQMIRMALQPIIDARTGVVVAREALMRSAHPTLKSPLDILAAAELHSALDEMGMQVARRIAELLPRLAEDEKVFINLHPRDLRDVDELMKRFACFGEHRQRVVLEITERSSVLELSSWERAVRVLQDSGYQLAVDDVGAGYNSLAVLAELQPQYIKVDRSIVVDCHKHGRKQRLLELLCRFADSTETTLIAEGVECAEEAEALRECGAHYLQGYFFGRPSLELDSAGGAAAGAVAIH